MSNISGIKKVSELLQTEQTCLPEITGALKRDFPLSAERVYVIPGYQREIRWTEEDVQTLIDDLIRGGKKFLGTITISTIDGIRCEMIDGQQRLTVLTLMINYLNEFLPEKKRFNRICPIENESFKGFQLALENKFDFDMLKRTNSYIYDEIVFSDVLHQRDDFKVIWDCICERTNTVQNKERFLSAILESDINIIVNHLDGTESQRKFCIDYFIDINDKRKELDHLDIIRAYAFKEDFESMTDHWIAIQNKCVDINAYAKYSREELFNQYFGCMVNKELGNGLTKPISEKYLIKEKVIVGNHTYSKGSAVWNLFSNDKFYAEMLKNLDDYLDFINLVLSIENGGVKEFKEYFYDENKKPLDSVFVLNAHTIINSVLRNDDVVPKMMVMKYYLEVLKPLYVEKKKYSVIHTINIIATLFSARGKGKGSEQIAGKIVLVDWANALKDLALKMLAEISSTTDFAKISKTNRKYTVESGQYMARRYLTLCDAYSWTGSAIITNEKVFNALNLSTGAYNMEHFIINRDFKYALYESDNNEKISAQISLPTKLKKYIATITNYLIIDSTINSQLKNRPVYEKIEILMRKIESNGLENVIPSKRSQWHYYQIKDKLHDKSRYPKKEIDEAKNRKERQDLLKNYFERYFEEEFLALAREMDNEEFIFFMNSKEKLMKLGFTYTDGDLVYEDTCCNVTAEIDSKGRSVALSMEVFNPYYGEMETEIAEKKYAELLKKVLALLKNTFRKDPDMSSSKDYGCSYDESITYTYTFKMDENMIRKFLNTVNEVDSL